LHELSSPSFKYAMSGEWFFDGTNGDSARNFDQAITQFYHIEPVAPLTRAVPTRGVTKTGWLYYG